MRMNHCSDTSGSIRSPERCEYGTVWVSGSLGGSRPAARSSATTASRASSTVRPTKRSGAGAIIRPSSPITLIRSRPWRLPISKSLGSWPGVIFSAPLPNSGLTYSSAMIGSVRSVSGRRTRRPISAR